MKNILRDSFANISALDPSWYTKKKFVTFVEDAFLSLEEFFGPEVGISISIY